MNLRQHLKFIARGYMTSAKPSPLLVGLAGVALLQVLSILEQFVTDAARRTAAITEAANAYMENGSTQQLMSALESVELTMPQQLLQILLAIVSLMVSTGLVIYAISAIRYHKGSFGNLLDGLPILGRVMWYQIVSSVYIAFWTMLFVIPGILATYSYRMGLYLLLDHPEMSVSECLKASRRMMQGNRWELFVIDLSFFGWNMGLSMIAYGAAAGGLGYMGTLLSLPLAAFVTIYMQFTDFLYYEHLLGRHYDTSIPAADPTQP